MSNTTSAPARNTMLWDAPEKTEAEDRADLLAALNNSKAPCERAKRMLLAGESIEDVQDAWGYAQAAWAIR